MAVDWTNDEKLALAGQAKLPLTSPGVTGSDGPPAAPAGTKMDDLLKPTRDVKGEDFVQFGKVQVERNLMPQWVEAQKYLGKSPEAVNSLYDLQHGKETIKVHEINDGNDLYNPNTHTINWDPKSGLVAADGKMQTPANGLLHEQGHASEFKNHPDRFEKQVRLSNQRYDDGEEQRNITWEAKYSKELGEAVRSDHGGLPVNTKGPASIEITDKALTDPAEIKAALHGERFGQAVHGYTPPPAPGNDANAIVKWDGKAHSGPVVHLNGDTVAQYVADAKGGPGQYQVYDVGKDLHGVMPPENNPHTAIDHQGHIAGRTPEVSSVGR
jgi:hypothetical protein